MPRNYHSPTRDIIIAAIKEAGPMSSAQLVEYTGLSRRSIDSAVHFARFGAQRKLLYIKTHIRNYGLRGKPAPVYNVGARKDAEPPASDRAADRRRYAEKMRAVVRLRDQKRQHGKTLHPWLQQLMAA